MYNFQHKNVLITGGASGIGKLMGEIVLKKGANLIIWDINQKNIEETLTLLSPFGKVSAYLVDVSNTQNVNETAEKVKKEHDFVDVIINNAGIIVEGYFHQQSEEAIRRTMAINATAPMFVTAAFLPEMIQENKGAICNIASSAGLISNPRMAVYAASKWALVGWSDSLRLEMKQLNKQIGVTTVTPYYIDTGMFDGVKSVIPLLNPEKAARQIISGIEKQKIYVSMPWSVGFVRFFQGLLPIWFFDWFVGKVFKVYHTMDHFTGRKV